MVVPQPNVIVIAGPNWAGKSTCAASYVPGGVAFINADEMAKGLPDYPSRSADIQAGRLVLEQMDALERQRADFAVETTLASRSLAARMARLRRAGYHFRLIFVWAPSADFCVDRVAQRVGAGGHHIPEETIRRRYEAGIKNFFHLYQPLADDWTVHDNTHTEGPRLVALGQRSQVVEIHDPDVWNRMEQRGRDERSTA